MATEDTEGKLRIITLSPQEAVNMIGLLTAQLAGVPLQGHAAGSAPSINITEHGAIKHRMIMFVKT